MNNKLFEFLKNWFYLTVELLIVALVVLLIVAMCIASPVIFFVALGLAGVVSVLSWYSGRGE